MIPLEHLEKVDRALLRAAAACAAPLPVDAAAKADIRRRTLEVLRIDPDWRPTIEAETVGVREFGVFRIEELAFESWRGFRGKASLYLPNGVERPPVVLFNHGHAMIDGRRAVAYQSMGQTLARHGTAMLVADVTGCGERAATGHKQRLKVFGSGTTVCGIIVLEAMGFVRYLRECGRFDTSRLGIAGQSGGGQTTLFLSALVPDEAALFAPSGFIHSFEFNARKGRRLCDCDLFPGIVGELEMYHLLGCVAPKPLLIASGSGDPMIARDVVINTAHRLTRIWQEYGAEENFERLRWKGGHSLATSPESLYGVANFILKHFGLPTVPEGTALPEAVYTAKVVPSELGEGDIDIEQLAEKLTGKKSPELHSIAEAFPPSLVPTDAGVDDDWRELLAQMESFISPRFL